MFEDARARIGMSRREIIASMTLSALCPTAGLARNGTRIPLATVARSPRYLCNAVALTSDNRMFLGLPRWEGMGATPSLVRVGQDGNLRPFPGNSWNDWKPGQDAREAFVMVNGIHIFQDDTLWVVDQGSGDRKATLPGAQKLVRLDSSTGDILDILRFDEMILPPGGQLNDLRISGSQIYVTDSGLGGIIVHDRTTGRSLRRLSRHPLTTQTPGRPLIAFNHKPFEDDKGKRPTVHSDMLEVTADGRWLYFCTPTGPLRRVKTALLRDESLDDAALAEAVETIANLPTIMGTAIDTLGNIYFTDTEKRRIVLLTPSGRQETLIQDDRLVNGDAMFITADRHVYVPCAQTERMAMFNHGRDGRRPPWSILSFALPRSFAGHRLGDAVTH